MPQKPPPLTSRVRIGTIGYLWMLLVMWAAIGMVLYAIFM